MVSSDYRITPSMTAQQSLVNLQRQIDALNTLQNQESSQKALQKPSDNPVALVQAMHYRSDTNRNSQISRNIGDGLTWLNLADSTMNGIVTQLQRVRDL